MRNKTLFKLVFAVFLAAILITKLQAQTEFTGADANRLVNGATKILMNDERKNISFVYLSEDEFVPEPERLNWLQNAALKTADAYSFKLIRKQNDKLGYAHYKYKQYFNGDPLEHGVYNIHAKNGRVVSANGEFYTGISKTLKSKNKLTYEDAEKSARKYFKYQNAVENVGGNEKSLTILKTKDGFHYCYKIELYCHTPLKKSRLYVDASNGNIVLEEERIHTTDVAGSAQTAFSGTQAITCDQVSSTNYRLRETGRGGGINTKNCNNGSSFPTATDFTSTSSTFTASTLVDKSPYDLHYGLEKTYDYFYNTYGLNSLTGWAQQLTATHITDQASQMHFGMEQR